MAPAPAPATVTVTDLPGGRASAAGRFGARHVALAAAGGAALAVVALVDPSRHAVGPPCPLRLLTGLDCPLCGATRATHALLRGDVATALDFNALYVVALLPMLAVGLAWLVRGSRPAWTLRPWLAWAVLGVAVVFAVVRNLPFGPFAFLGSTPGRR